MYGIVGLYEESKVDFNQNHDRIFLLNRNLYETKLKVY